VLTRRRHRDARPRHVRLLCVHIPRRTRICRSKDLTAENGRRQHSTIRRRSNRLPSLRSAQARRLYFSPRGLRVGAMQQRMSEDNGEPQTRGEHHNTCATRGAPRQQQPDRAWPVSALRRRGEAGTRLPAGCAKTCPGPCAARCECAWPLSAKAQHNIQHVPQRPTYRAESAPLCSHAWCDAGWPVKRNVCGAFDDEIDHGWLAMLERKVRRECKERTSQSTRTGNQCFGAMCVS